MSALEARADLIKALTCDLCDRVERRAALGDRLGPFSTGHDYGKGEGLGKTQIHADIVQLRRMLALLDKEVNDAD